jgi:hypothetical protein
MAGGTAGYNASMKVLFVYGWHSVPGGVKPTKLAWKKEKTR